MLMAQLDRYPEDLQNDVNFLSDFSSFNKNVDFAGRMVYDDKGVEVFNFGKYKGMSVAEVLKRDPADENPSARTDSEIKENAYGKCIERQEDSLGHYGQHCRL